MNDHSAQALRRYPCAPTGKLFFKPGEAFAMLGVGRNKGYQLVAKGKLKLVKDGYSSFITADSVFAYAASLIGEAA